MSLFEEGMRMTMRHARARIGEEDDKLEAAKRAGAFEDVTLSNAVPGDGVGLPMYMTTSGTGGVGGMGGVAESLLPEEGLFKFFVAATIGIAIAGLPSSLLVPRLGTVKGYLAGGSVSGAILTALWYFNKEAARRRGTETVPQKVG